MALKILVKYSSDETIHSSCKLSILLAFTFVEIKKSLTKILLIFKFVLVRYPL